MKPTWERSPEAPWFDGDLFMDAVLRPHRSLSAKTFKYMLVAVIAVNVAVAVFFWAQGAFPVAGFLGLDVLAQVRKQVHDRLAGRYAAKVQPLAREVLDERRRTRVGNHPLNLLLEYLGLMEAALRTKLD
jgi:uncharacterized membrane protein